MILLLSYLWLSAFEMRMWVFVGSLRGSRFGINGFMV